MKSQILTEKLTDSHGWRVYFEVKPNEKLTLTATETNVERQTVTLGHNWMWVQRNIIQIENPLAQEPQILACLKIQKKIDQNEEDQQEGHNRVNEVEQQVERVRSNLESAQAVASGGKLDKWIDDLDTSEDEIRTINEKALPELREKRTALQEELTEALTAVTASWKADGPKAAK